MTDLEAVLADVSYIMAMEKSREQPAARASRKIQLPDASVHSVMHQYLAERGEVTFRCIFSQTIGYRLYADFGQEMRHQPLIFYDEILQYEKISKKEDRLSCARRLYDSFIMPDLLIRTKSYSQTAENGVKLLLQQQQAPQTLFSQYKIEVFDKLHAGDNLFDEFLISNQYVRFCQWKNLELNQSLTMHEFTVHRIIGRGGFGEVYGCRKIDTGMMYAMKCLDKKRLKLKKGESGPINERNMLALVNNPFVVCMTYAFQTPGKICIVLDLMNGGDLNYHLAYYKAFSESWVRFYAQEIILALEHLHSLQIVYRDLKPANCLLSAKGHLKITDLGLAYDISKAKPYERVGTHGYMAPEVLQKDKQYDCCADWFSFGCIMYKMLSGHSPFRSRDRTDIDKQTLTMEVNLPSAWSDEARSIISSLLVKDPSCRLGREGSFAVKQDAFFAETVWEDVEALKCKPPFVPPKGEVNAAHAFQIGVFEDDDVKGIKLTEEDQSRYKGFDMVVSARWQEEICVTTVFDVVNGECDRIMSKKINKMKRNTSLDESIIYDVKAASRQEGDCLVQGYLQKQSGPFSVMWHKRYYRLYPNRLEWSEDLNTPVSNMITIENVGAVVEIPIKGAKCLKLSMKEGLSERDYILRPESKPEYEVWFKQLSLAVANVELIMQSGPKAFRPLLLSHEGRSVPGRVLRRMSNPSSDQFPASGAGASL